MAALLGQGPFYKVGVSCTREATFGAERIVLAVFGKYFPRKLAENHGRVAKIEVPERSRLAPIGSGRLRHPGAEARPGTSLPHALGVRMT